MAMFNSDASLPEGREQNTFLTMFINDSWLSIINIYSNMSFPWKIIVFMGKSTN